MAKLAWVCPPDGCPMAKNPATPAAAAATPANMARSARVPPGRRTWSRFRRYQEIRTAKTRSKTRSGCTSARLPKLSATTCRANPTTLAPTAASHSGWRTRSSMIRGDSAPRAWIFFVLR